MSSKRIFVTGASGLIGRALLESLAVDALESVRALTRQKRAEGGGVEWIEGDLGHVDFWASALEGCDSLLHLGACTGRASAEEHARINLEATRSLVRAARDARVKRMVFVSTIAAGYPELDRYPYAAAKREAEASVSASTLDWTIVRPTIVLGTAGGIGPMLVGLARKRRTPLFGAGLVRLQPIGARDTADLIIQALRDPTTLRETIDLGGPDVLTFTELLTRLRVAVGREPKGLLHLPLKPAMAAAWTFERLFGPRLPVLAGQLYAFRYDSTARRSGFLDARMARMTRIDALIAELARGGDHG
ncbi:MAG: NAD(P)H-binding protein [Planctomycetota bacterium]